MQQLIYRWLIFLGISHVLLGLLFAVLANTQLFAAYTQYLFKQFDATQAANQVDLLGTMLQLFGVTVASWGVLFTVAVHQYWCDGGSLLKKAICIAVVVWLVLDTCISLYWGIEVHAYLNMPVGLAMLLPMLLLKPRQAVNYRIVLPEQYKLNDKKKFLITGGTGFIGKPLVQTLIDQGHEVIVLTRNIASGAKGIQGKVTYITALDYVSDKDQIDVIINLAGEPLAGSRWNKKKKAGFLSSRLNTTSELLALVQRLEQKPQSLISGSAIGFYGPHADEELDEQAGCVDGFSHQLCHQWEQAALKFEEHGLRVCLLRMGVVLGKNGGPLVQLQIPFKLKVATQLGEGKQWMSWVHLDDVIAMMCYLVAQHDIEGAVNITAPQPVTNEQFAESLGRVEKTWFKFRMPAAWLKVLVGEMATEVLLTGQRVVPSKIVKNGYQFKYPELHSCLKSLS
ncbi:TIGR01777 family oxidoreductase [Spartinivicinus poritis]|uniref:TIGR01777 family oxidoreductase n=1 Tax=Spartinivicinus poritis TaxID=2994640 RepID=A0ABT5UEA2_9GAMM|nr:TIGR01777 family oxidoreductase [Spartinivicinus sp. A2-2]MDE1464709.1 TIGR01777 family oxidoreductase [Spartinivicinus sp. A2-2]